MKSSNKADAEQREKPAQPIQQNSLDNCEAQLASQNGSIIFSTAVFLFILGLTLGIWFKLVGHINIPSIFLGLLLAWMAMSATHIVHQWEKLVVLRFGKFNRVSGPGLVFTLPIIEYGTMRVDQRVRAIPFGAKETLTADLVPLDVDAVLFWMVWDAEKACMEVTNFTLAVQLAAQTALRDAIGRGEVAQITIRRNQLDKELQRVLEEKVNPWGITILSVEIRDILVPDELQNVMSLEAQAEQHKKARIILMEAEQDISEMISEMSELYKENEHALKLRSMHLLYESVRETGGTIVIPSGFSESFNENTLEDMGKLLKRKMS